MVAEKRDLEEFVNDLLEHKRQVEGKEDHKDYQRSKFIGKLDALYK
jgi:hypothetical protein